MALKQGHSRSPYTALPDVRLIEYAKISSSARLPSLRALRVTVTGRAEMFL